MAYYILLFNLYCYYYCYYYYQAALRPRRLEQLRPGHARRPRLAAADVQREVRRHQHHRPGDAPAREGRGPRHQARVGAAGPPGGVPVAQAAEAVQGHIVRLKVREEGARLEGHGHGAAGLRRKCDVQLGPEDLLLRRPATIAIILNITCTKQADNVYTSITCILYMYIYIYIYRGGTPSPTGGTPSPAPPRGGGAEYVCVYIYIYIYMYMSIHVIHIYICLYIYRERDRYTHQYIHVYIYIYINKAGTCFMPLWRDRQPQSHDSSRVFLKSDKQLPVEQFEAAVSHSTYFYYYYDYYYCYYHYCYYYYYYYN